MENRGYVKEKITEQFRIWREGKIKAEDGVIGILEQKGIENSDLAEAIISLIEKLQEKQ